MESVMADDEQPHLNPPDDIVSGNTIHQDTARLHLATSFLRAVSPASSPAIKSGISPVWKSPVTVSS
jgi:hypothetical protein